MNDAEKGEIIIQIAKKEVKEKGLVRDLRGVRGEIEELRRELREG